MLSSRVDDEGFAVVQENRCLQPPLKDVRPHVRALVIAVVSTVELTEVGEFGPLVTTLVIRVNDVDRQPIVPVEEILRRDQDEVKVTSVPAGRKGMGDGSVLGRRHCKAGDDPSRPTVHTSGLHLRALSQAFCETGAARQEWQASSKSGPHSEEGEEGFVRCKLKLDNIVELLALGDGAPADVMLFKDGLHFKIQRHVVRDKG